jgi:putative pyruvate formate lyase activating enzyme
LAEEPFVAAYLKLAQSGELARRAESLKEMLGSCTLCPRQCRVNRGAGEIGWCGAGADVFISSYGRHLGEESVLVGRYGSGTIFFAGCTLGCVFCQNYDISQLRHGYHISQSELADIMIELQDQRCHNINFVSPTHQIAQIVEAVELAAKRGLRVPLVYNTGGYDSLQTLALLDGILDIYMPDIKYGDNGAGKTYSGAPDYWDRCREAVREMHRQVGDLEVGNGALAIATRGLLVRHLVLPSGLAGTANVARFLADEVGRKTFINVMPQYRPAYDARRYPELARPITPEEYAEAIRTTREAGLDNIID